MAKEVLVGLSALVVEPVNRDVLEGRIAERVGSLSEVLQVNVIDVAVQEESIQDPDEDALRAIQRELPLETPTA